MGLEEIGNSFLGAFTSLGSFINNYFQIYTNSSINEVLEFWGTR